VDDGSCFVVMMSQGSKRIGRIAVANYAAIDDGKLASLGACS